MTAQNDSYFTSDLTGKLIIKARLGDDVRCIPIHNEDINYEELVLMMLRVFSGQLSNKDEITIKYKDDDGDLITMMNDTDVAFAIHCSKVLKITIFVNSKSKPSVGDDVAELCKLLTSVKDVACRLLDSFEPGKTSKRSTPVPPATDAQKPNLPDSDQKSGGCFPTLPMKNEGKEFDPLSADARPHPPQESNMGPGFNQPSFPGSRSQTPSSSSSNVAPQHPSQFQPFPPPAPHPSPSAPSANLPQPQQQPFPDQQNTGGGYPPQSQMNGGSRMGGPMAYPAPPSSVGNMPAPGTSAPYRPPTAPTSYPPGSYSVAGYPSQPVQTGLPGGQQGVGQAYPNYPPYGPSQSMGGQPSGAGTSGYYMNQGPPSSSGDVRAQNFSPVPPSQGGQNPYSRGPSQGHMYPRPHGQYPHAQ